MIQDKKIKREGEEKEEGGGGEKRKGKRGRGKFTISLRSIRRTLEVEVLHYVPERLVIFFIDAIAP